MSALSNRELTEDRIRAEIDEAKQIIDNSIKEVNSSAKRHELTPEFMKDANGRLLLADLIATKAQLILAEVLLLKGELMSSPPPIETCIRNDHPTHRHGHYGPGGRYFCMDFNSPLLYEENAGVVKDGYIVIFEKER